MQEPKSSLRGYQFGAFEVDLHSGEIRKSGLKIKVQEQPFRVLILLLEHSPNVVTREDFRKQLWDESIFVEFDHSLSNAIGRIRETLGDSADNPRFIETFPKRGYRFIAPVEKLVGTHPRGSKAEVNDDGGKAGAQASEANWIAKKPERLEVAIPARRLWLAAGVASVLLLTAALFFAARLSRNAVVRPLTYTQITNFSDAAFSPAISPDGRMIAFIHGSDMTFPPAGEIYTKMLPDGEPVQVTRDGLPKYGVAFSLDGSQVAYTALDPKHAWETMIVSPLGGDPRVLFLNATGLTWLDEHHLLFSEIKSGLHMGLVTATDRRSDTRDIYLPEHERGMAHYSYISPDRKRVLVVEMGGTGAWQRCRLVPFDGSSAGSQVGPNGACTSAAWSPDGNWMYFTASVKGASHLWRQRFSDGQPEQITSGPLEEVGVAMSRDGRSIVSAVGLNESGLWLHDSHGERLVSSEGYASRPSFSRDGRFVYYLLRRQSSDSPSELWMTEMASGRSEPVIRGFSINSYALSLDGKRAVFSTSAPDGASQLWLASCDRAFPPRLLSSDGEDWPFFGPDNAVVFRMSVKGKNYLFRMNADGSGRAKIFQKPIGNPFARSADGRWVVTRVPDNEEPYVETVAVPVTRGSVRKVCPAACMVKWSPDGARFYVDQVVQGTKSGLTIAIPVPAGKSLPDLPVSGIRSVQDSASLPGSKVIDLSGLDPTHFGTNLAPGPKDETFVYTKTIAHRNLFQISLP